MDPAGAACYYGSPARGWGSGYCCSEPHSAWGWGAPLTAPPPAPAPPDPGPRKRARKSGGGSEAHRLERAAARERQRLEREERRAAAQALRYMRPDQCVRYMRVCVDPAVLGHANGHVLLDGLESQESEYSIEPQAIPSSITWRREIPEVILSEHSDVVENIRKSDENQVVVLLSPHVFLTMVWLYKQKLKGNSGQNIGDSSENFRMTILEKPLEKRATLVVIGLDSYTSPEEQRSPVKMQQNGDSVREDNSESWVSMELGLTCADLNEVQVALQLQTYTTVRFLENWHKFASYIATLTKAIAQAPFKKHTENATFSFCPDGTWSSGVKVDKDGKGLLKLWKKQLQQLNRITRPVAVAIADAYPTPKLLLQAYRECGTEWEKQNLLAEIKVNAGGKRVDRRIGPDISRRLYIYMTSENSDRVLDKSG